MNQIPGMGEEAMASGKAAGADQWLRLASDAFSSSTSYYEQAYRPRFESALAHFQNRHEKGSKYHLDSFKFRSKVFRPKSRAMVRKAEASAAAAFFSNVDVVQIEPQNEFDARQKVGAEVMQELLNYRLNRSIPWFITVIGALQESKVYGMVCSYQYWHFKGDTITEPLMDEMGQPVFDESGEVVMQERVVAKEDKPCVQLIPVENIRFDPGADWTDPVGTSPYIIRMIPMQVQDVRARMNEENNKTYAKPWKKYDDAVIRTAMSEYDSMRMQRENEKPDPLSEPRPLGDFEIVWVHENFMRRDGEELVYYTLGTTHMLSDPVPLEEVYFTGKRPFVIGTSALEAHRAVPTSDVELGSHLQREVNDVANQRLDNVKLVLNKRWIVKRNRNVDIESLNRNVPGGVTLADNTEDVQEVNWPDVTGSSYQEQDRLNLDFDDLLGNFSQSSVMSNRQLNETVGGMKMLGAGANQIVEYSLRTFVETWMEPVLYQLVALEQKYETDQSVLMIAGERANLRQKYGVDRVTDEMISHDMTVRVNVGMGATDPNQKLQKLGMSLDMYGRFLALPGVDPVELRKLVFGYSGIRGAMTAFKEQGQEGPPPEMMQQMQMMKEALQKLSQENQQLKAGTQGKMIDAKVKAQDSQIRAQTDSRNAELQAQATIRSAMIQAQARLAEKDKDIEARRMEAEIKAQAEIAKQAMAQQGHEQGEGAEGGGSGGSGRAQSQPVVVNVGAGEDEVANAIGPSLAMLAQAIEKLAQPERKVMRVQAPDGGVYEGVMVEGQLTVTEP